MNERALQISSRINEIHKELQSFDQNPRLVAVTKYSPIEDVVLAYQSEQFDFGENKVQDLKLKADYFFEHNYHNVRWHFIGHLQSNKVKDLLKIPHLYAIHSIDSLKLIDELIKRKSEIDQELNIFLQFNTSNEEEKSGFESEDELYEAIRKLNSEPKFKFYGLMTMGTIRTENVEEEAQRCFSELVKLKNKVEKDFKLSQLKLSMGMSGDYKLALQNGSDYIRIGTKIFK